jgi:hypothetical protein
MVASGSAWASFILARLRGVLLRSVGRKRLLAFQTEGNASDVKFRLGTASGTLRHGEISISLFKASA